MQVRWWLGQLMVQNVRVMCKIKHIQALATRAQVGCLISVCLHINTGQHQVPMWRLIRAPLVLVKGRTHLVRSPDSDQLHVQRNAQHVLRKVNGTNLMLEGQWHHFLPMP